MTRRELVIVMDLENDAFNPDATFEVARILRELADRIEERSAYGTRVGDINGNTVGTIGVRTVTT